MQIDKKADFVLKGNKVLHPPVRTDGLELYYDTKGKKNSDLHKDKLLDMSGNDRHGELHNFSYKNLSGYQEDSELVFDGIEDTLELEEVEGVEVVSATRNLFNIIRTTPYNMDSVIKDGAWYVASSGSYGGTIFDKFQTIIGKTYTISFTYKSSDNSGFYTISNNLGKALPPLYGSNKSMNLTADGKEYRHSITFTATNTEEITISLLRAGGAVDSGSISYKDIQIEEGSTATPYVPYIPTAKMTYQLNNNVISYGEGGTVKWVKDGKAVERKGINLVRNGNFFDGTNGWISINGTLKSTSQSAVFTYNNSGNTYCRISRGLPQDVVQGEKIYVRAKIKALTKTPGLIVSVRAYTGGDYGISSIPNPEIGAEHTIEGIHEPEEKHVGGMSVRIGMNPIENSSIEISEIQYVNLTATYGAGNEPTLEEIQADPDKWQWLPNPMDLLETKELGGNILGDMEDIIDDHTRDEQSGVEVFTDKADDSLVRVEIDGQSYQHVGSGKNLSHKNTFTGTVHRSSETTHAVDKVIEYNIPISPNSTYTLSGIRPPNLGLTIFATTTKVQESITGHNTMYNHVISGGIGVQVTNYKVPVGYNYVTITTGGSFGNNYHSIGASLTWSNIQLEEGSTATAYEPPVPTPDYPIEIHSLNDFDVVSSVGRENIFQLSKFKDIPSYSSSVVSLIKNGFRLTNTYGYGINFAKPDLKPGKTYTISGEVVIRSGTGNGIEGRFVSLTKDAAKVPSIMLYYGGGGKFTSTFSTPTDFNYDNYHGLHAYGISTKADGIPGVVDFINIKIEEGKDQTPYSLSSEEISENSENQFIDKINLNLAEPLRGVDDVKDRIFRDSDGLWKVERNVGVTILDGSEQIIRYPLTDDFPDVVGFYTRPKTGGVGIHRLGRSTHLVSYPDAYYPGRLTANREEFQVTIDNWLKFSLSKTRIDSPDINGLKKWLSEENSKGHPLAVFYGLKDREIETLDQELQDKLNDLRSFQDSNYVYTVINDKTDTLPSYISENLKPTIHTEFLAHDHFKESRTVNNLLIWNRSLEDEELLGQNKLFHGRFKMRSNTIKGEPINQEINLLNGGVFGHSLEQNYTIEI